MPAWNLPHWLMNLSGVTGAGTLLAAGAAMAWRHRLPLPLAAALWHTAAAGAAVSVCSSEKLAKQCVGLVGKDPTTGRIGWLRYAALAPYHLGILVATFLYRAASREQQYTQLAEGLYVGGWPMTAAALPGGDVAPLDVTNELNARVRGVAYKAVRSWETHGLDAEDIQEGVDWALQQRQQGHSVLVYCTHGHGRSAAMAAAILVAAGEESSPEAALKRVKKLRPGASPNQRQVQQLKGWAAMHGRQG